MEFEPRTYRRSVRPSGLVGFRVVEAQTDLLVHAETDLTDQAREAVRELRADLETYLLTHPRFAESFVPFPADATAPAIVQEMARTAAAAGVGPMAGVAGAFAEAIARSLAPSSAEVIVENGGDVYLMGTRERIVGLWAGSDAPAVGLSVGADLLPCAIATSSATIGPSTSLGSADAATVIAASGALADAVASMVGNRVHSEDDLEAALEAGGAIDGVRGIVVVAAGRMAAWGAIRLVPLASGSL